MTPYVNIGVTEITQVGEARRAAVRLADDLQFDDVGSGRVALVVTELATNLARHATAGRLLIGRRAGAARTIEVVSLDTGPGMTDLARCLRDGFSTGGTPGTGLGAIQRLANDFDVHTEPGHGTIVVAGIAASAPAVGSAAASGRAASGAFEYAGIGVAAPGETVCGDAWSVHTEGGKAWVLLADGLGHGPVAAEAADAAVTVFESLRAAPVVVLERAHQVLRSTRGAAVALAALDAAAGTIEFVGAGNVAGRLISGIGDRSLLSQHGTLGVQLRKLQPVTYPWPPHAVFVMHSDGIVSRWGVAEARPLLQQHPSVLAGWLLRDHCRGRDDATVVVLRRT